MLVNRKTVIDAIGTLDDEAPRPHRLQLVTSGRTVSSSKEATASATSNAGECSLQAASQAPPAVGGGL